MGKLLIDRDRPVEDLYRPHREFVEGCGSYGEVKKRIDRGYDSIARHERYLRYKSEKVSNRVRVLSETDVENIKKMRKQGQTLTAISKIFSHVSYSSVVKAAKGGYDE